MKLRSALGVAAGTVGATALANRLLAASAGPFEPFLAGDHGTYRWRGFDVAYAEAGDPAAQDLLLVHGVHAAASNHEFHRVFDRLADEYHVIAPDLPGFGHSDRPALLYSGALYETFVADAIADLTEDAPVVVGSSLSAAYAASAVAAEELDVDHLVLVSPTAETFGDDGRRWLRGLLRAPLVGQAVFNLLASGPAIRHFHADHGYADLSNLTDDVIDYEWLTAHQTGARFAPASFVSGFLDAGTDLETALADADAPTTLVWGREAAMPPLSTGRDLAESADARLVVFDHAKLLPHVEHPEQFVDVVERRFEALPDAAED
jgi:pimeloyl-ACP methyl ester carboxylesterase